jgi:hypothetical protein
MVVLRQQQSHDQQPVDHVNKLFHLVAVLLRQKDVSKDDGLNRNNAVLLHCMLLLHSTSSLIRLMQKLLSMS